MLRWRRTFVRIEALRYYREVVRCGSVTQAANLMFISQQGLSKIVTGLEEELGGVRLFRKVGRGLELTDEGAALDMFASRVLADYDALKEELVGIAKAREAPLYRPISLYTTPYVCNNLFNLLEDEIDRCGIGDLSLSINELDFWKISAGFGAGEIDLAMVNVAEPDYARLSSVAEVVPLMISEVAVLASPSIASRIPEKIITPPILSSLAVAHYNEPVLNRLVLDFCLKAEVYPPKLLQHSTNSESIRRLAGKGKAVTFSDTFSLSIRNPLEGSVVLRMKPALKFLCCFLVNPSLSHSSPERAFIRMFQEMFRIEHADYWRRATAWGEKTE